MNDDIMMAIQGFLNPEAWTPQLAQERGIIGRPLGEPGRVANANDIFQMLTQAVNMSGYDMAVPNPQGTDMTPEEYNTFLNTYQNFVEKGNVENRANQALGIFQKGAAGAASDPNLKMAQNNALNGGGMNIDIYAAMRNALQSAYDPRGLANNVANRGIRGSSGAELAANQYRGQNASNFANLYPQAMQSSQALNTQNMNNNLSVFGANQNAQLARESGQADILGKFFGSPDLMLQSS